MLEGKLASCVLSSSSGVPRTVLSLALVIPFLAVTYHSRGLDWIIKYHICFPCPRKISGCCDTLGI